MATAPQAGSRGPIGADMGDQVGMKPQRSFTCVWLQPACVCVPHLSLTMCGKSNQVSPVLGTLDDRYNSSNNVMGNCMVARGTKRLLYNQKPMTRQPNGFWGCPGSPCNCNSN